MNAKNKLISAKNGFSLVEMLTVIAIIVMIITITVPSLRTARRLAVDTRQKGEIHSIEVAIEMFQAELGYYPESSLLDALGDGSFICGSQQLAEAVVGRDLKGFDPKTTWYTPQEDAISDNVRYANAAKGSTLPQIDASRSRRKGPYYKLEKTGAYLMEQVYGVYNEASSSYTYSEVIYSSSGNPDYAYRAPVISDVYKQKRIILETDDGVWCGTPILYFKANTSLIITDPDKMLDPDNPAKSIYNIYDNYDLIRLGTVENANAIHHFDEDYEENYTDPISGTPAIRDGIDIFYNIIRNPKIETHTRPYNANSFILISAGDDGIFGTIDDVGNFKR